jgi:hypothetical protein
MGCGLSEIVKMRRAGTFSNSGSQVHEEKKEGLKKARQTSSSMRK